ncbi:hypothetical protein ACQPW1_22125 [Nocardia sp. CA-128927]|uniref:hypothetical protein n=1 Tax=Nocardia sp. CA-128927 TaxID=3239975 RepID=UPI003D96D472
MTKSDVDRMLIESAEPVFDAMIAEHQIVQADLATTFRAARSLDFLTVRTPLLTTAMWLRGLPNRWSGHPASPLPRLVVADGVGLPGWLLLGEQPEREITFGAVGKFWQPDIEWRDVAQADFAGFAEPGWGKIAANFSVERYGQHATLLSYQCRTVTTDPDSRQRFLRYWWLIRPFVAHIMRATVHTIRNNAEAAAPHAEGRAE